LGFIVAALPWSTLVACYQWFGYQFPSSEPLIIYMVRIFAATFGLIGIFYLILALNPLKYGSMLLLAVFGMLSTSAFCLVGGIWYSLPVFVYLFDVITCAVLGLLIMRFRKNAIHAEMIKVTQKDLVSDP
jgi:hypothetical protein